MTTNIASADSIGSWDVSANQGQTIIAWYHDVDSNGLYELTIGAAGNMVPANPDSSFLFYGLTELKTINLYNLDTSKVTNMSWMFCGVYQLTSLDLSNFDTSKVTNMSTMFNGMYGLISLDLSNFNTSKVTDMSYMFSGVESLTSLDFRNATFGLVNSYSFMFNGIKNNPTIYTKDATTKTWLESRISEASKTANVIVVS